MCRGQLEVVRGLDCATPCRTLTLTLTLTHRWLRHGVYLGHHLRSLDCTNVWFVAQLCPGFLYRKPVSAAHLVYFGASQKGGNAECVMQALAHPPKRQRHRHRQNNNGKLFFPGFQQRPKEFKVVDGRAVADEVGLGAGGLARVVLLG